MTDGVCSNTRSFSRHFICIVAVSENHLPNLWAIPFPDTCNNLEFSQTLCCSLISFRTMAQLFLLPF